MRKQITLKCPICNSDYNKDLSEHKRNIKLNRLSYCSLSCNAKKESNINHIMKVQSNYDISQHSKNKIDEFTNFRYYVKLIKVHKKEGSTLTITEMKRKWNEQKGLCPYTKIPLTPKTHSHISTYKLENWFSIASIDRIDSSKPYTYDNIEFVSIGINYLKNRYSKESVINFLKIICDNLKE